MLQNIEAVDFSKLHFLLIDDNQFIRRLLLEILRSWGAGSVRMVESPDEAWTEMKVRRPDIIFCDWMMSPVDGLSFLRTLRQTPGHQNIQVIMLTGHASVDHVSTALGEGANSYIVKPFSPTTLMEHVLKVISVCEVEFV